MDGYSIIPGYGAWERAICDPEYGHIYRDILHAHRSLDPDYAGQIDYAYVYRVSNAIFDADARHPFGFPRSDLHSRTRRERRE